MNPAALVAYLALFAAVAVLFVLACLAIGRLLRARVPTPEKSQAYESGELPVGPGYLQLDLRSYVVALVFIVFEVEVALFFPWAVVFGKATQLADPRLPKVVAFTPPDSSPEAAVRLSPQVVAKLREFGVPDVAVAVVPGAAEPTADRIEQGARRLALTAIVDLAAFFTVLLVGFAYVWHRGDLDWVKAIGRATALGGPTTRVERGAG